MFNPSDNLPPTFVRDWRQLLHNKGYICLMALVYVLAWMLLLSPDWSDINETMKHAYEPVYCSCFGDEAATYGHSYFCYGISRICRKMAELNTSLVFCAMALMGLLIPLRVGNAVSADTRVKGTNFLQVTPLSSWEIVSGMWLSAFSQVLVAALLALPLIFVRAVLMPTGNEADWYGLLYLVMFGGVASAALMFISGLPQLLRYPLLAGLIFLGCVVTVSTTSVRNFDPAGFPWYCFVLQILAAALITLLFLQLARRPYAAPAENTALPVRLTSLVCLAVGGILLFCPLAGFHIEGIEGGKAMSIGVELPAFVLIVTALGGAVMEAILPVVSLPVHAKRTLPGFPAWPQMPGALQSAAFLFIPILVLSASCYFALGSRYSLLMIDSVIKNGDHSAIPFISCLGTTLTIWTTAVLSICVGDFFVRRSSSRRPLAIPMTFFCLAIFSVVLCGVSGAVREGCFVFPFVNIVASIEAFADFMTCFDVSRSFPPRWDVGERAGACVTSFVIALIEAGLAFWALAARVRSSRQLR